MLLPDYFLKTVFEADLDFLNKNNVRAVIFDIDNTLVGFKEPLPSDEVKDYINLLLDSGIKVSVASNNNEERVALFCSKLNVPFVYRACKPLPFKLLVLCRKMGVKARETALIGDQIYTDMLGANLCGMLSVMVDIIDTKENLTFRIKRALERPVINVKRRKDNKNG